MESEGAAALQRLRSVHAPRYLSPSPELSKDARAAARYLYASLVPFCRKSSAGPPSVDNLLADEAFDAEQIWYQIDLLSRPILPILRRHLHRLEVNPPPSSASAACAGAGAAEVDKRGPDTNDEEESDGEEEREEDGEEEDATEAAAMEEEDDDVAGDYDEEDEESEGAERDVEGNAANTVEDKFLKIKQLEEYLKKDEEKEYGLVPEKKRKIRKEEEEEDDESELDDFDDDGGDESELQDMDDDDDEEEEEEDDEMNLAEDAKYEDFFGGNKKRKRNSKRYGEKQSGPNEMLDEDVHDEQNDEVDEDVHDERNDAIQDGKNLSTHEKELQKLRQKIEQMEKDNLKPKSWTMQGEVTASKRQKNSALEVDLDFEHNIRPAPVITEEVTASLEDLIRKRVIEGHFDDVQRTPALTSKAPKEHKELDENKSAKGLAEIYEEEYTQKTGLAAAPISTSDELKKEANILFKKICSKLDALSHFHFAPKPVIEEMSIQANVPALAMEEIAPVAVSDAAMLAPEEIFEGKGDIKEQSELTQADRKRRRASKKRKFRARVKSSHKASATASVVTNQSNGS